MAKGRTRALRALVAGAIVGVFGAAATVLAAVTSNRRVRSVSGGTADDPPSDDEPAPAS